MHLQFLSFRQGPDLGTVAIPHVPHKDIGPRKSMTFLGASGDLAGILAASGASVESLPVAAEATGRHVCNLDGGHVFFMDPV